SGIGFSAAAEGHQCARLLLAFARVSAVSRAVVAAAVLGREARAECRERQARSASTAAGRLARAGRLGMSNAAMRSGATGSKNPKVSCSRDARAQQRVALASWYLRA